MEENPTPQGLTPKEIIDRMRRQGAVIPNNIVGGHVRKDGTWVRPHIRFSPIKIRKRSLQAMLPPSKPEVTIKEPYLAEGHLQPSWNMKDEAPVISCRNCYFFNWSKPGTCDAFPQGIPDDIAYGRVIHNTTYPGDGGTSFVVWTKKIDDEENSFPGGSEAVDE